MWVYKFLFRQDRFKTELGNFAAQLEGLVSGAERGAAALVDALRAESAPRLAELEERHKAQEQKNGELVRGEGVLKQSDVWTRNHPNWIKFCFVVSIQYSI